MVAYYYLYALYALCKALALFLFLSCLLMYRIVFINIDYNFDDRSLIMFSLCPGCNSGLYPLAKK